MMDIYIVALNSDVMAIIDLLVDVEVDVIGQDPLRFNQDTETWETLKGFFVNLRGVLHPEEVEALSPYIVSKPKNPVRVWA